MPSYVSVLYCVLELQAARLHIYPSKSQFFWYENLMLSCVGDETSSDSEPWMLKKNNSEPCSRLGVSSKSSCKIDDAYPSVSGVYWCESESGEISNTIKVIVNGIALICSI